MTRYAVADRGPYRRKPPSPSSPRGSDPFAGRFSTPSVVARRSLEVADLRELRRRSGNRDDVPLLLALFPQALDDVPRRRCPERMRVCLDRMDHVLVAL